MKSRKWADIGSFSLVLLVLVLLNIALSGFFFRLDLTEDKRFSIMPATERMLGNLTDPVFIEVFLEGEFPAGFERLQNSVRETLEEFRVYAGENIQYSFTDPSASADQKTRNQTYQTLVQRGLTPTNLSANDGGKRTEKIIFPGAVLSLGGKEEPITLLKGSQSQSPQQRLNQSVENVEYEMALAIKKLIQQKRKRVAIIDGHGEKTGTEINDLALGLKGLVDLERVKLPERKSLSGYDAALIIKPDSAFSESDKYKLDQLVVNGGKLVFYLDAFPSLKLDSIKPDGSLLVPPSLNLDDLLFRYGARLNPDLVMDMNSAYIPMVVGIVGDQPQTQPVPWPYYPLISTFGRHPVVRNLDNLILRFASTIDTVKAVGIKKTILASTSRYSRIMASPVRMSFNEARIPPTPEAYKYINLPVAVLLEGKFTSLYKDRLAPHTQSQLQHKDQNLPGAVVLVSDGDLVLNEINTRKQTIYPLGYDRTAGITFGNKDFALNLMAYLLDDEGLILARQKEIALRPLDKVRVSEEKSRWQTINMALPLVVVAMFGFTRGWIRRRRYARPVSKS